MDQKELEEKAKNAVVVVRDDWWYYGMWYVYAGPKNECDWMAVVWKESKDPNDPNHKWKGVYRFRYYAGPEIFNSKDKRSVYTLEGPADTDPAKMAEAMHMVAGMVALRNQSKVDFIDCQSTGEKLLMELHTGKYVWAHTRMEDGGNPVSNNLWRKDGDKV